MHRCALFFAVLLVAACEVTEVKVQKVLADEAMIQTTRDVIAESLRDPMSAQYRNFAAYAVGDGQTLLCGELNAKNGFGGYNGFGSFFAVFDSTGGLKRYVVDAQQGWPNAANTCGAAAKGSYFR